MKNFIESIKTIEELGTKIEERQAEIKAIDAEAVALEAVENGNQLDKQNERLIALQTALDALSTDSAKQVIKTEIASIETSISNIKRLSELATNRDKALVKLQKLSTDLIAVASTYKGYRLNFEKKYNKLSKDTQKLLQNENVPEEFEIDEEETAVDTAEDETAKEPEVKEKLTLENTENEEVKVSPATAAEKNTEVEEKKEEAEFDSKVTHPILSLARVLKQFEELTGQVGAERYSSRYSSVFKEMSLDDSDKLAINQILNVSDVPELTDDQVKILMMSIPKDLVAKMKRGDIINERRASTDVYSAGYLNNFRPAFTYKVIAQLGRLILSSDNETDKKVKINLFFKQNSDHIVKGRFGGAKPEYRAFAVLRPEDLEEDS